MGASKQPEVVHPGEAAQAATGAAAAGEMMSVANQPIDQYGNLTTTMALGPAEQRTAVALANQAALQSAQAQQDIQSRVDPMAYAQRQMRMAAANARLGQLYGVNPQAFTYRAPGAYTVPGTSDLPNLADLRANAAAIASNLSTASLNKAGADPRLNPPRGAGALPITTAATMPAAVAQPSYY
jgi:hypothetical protein